jgi:hypothetical protein
VALDRNRPGTPSISLTNAKHLAFHSPEQIPLLKCPGIAGPIHTPRPDCSLTLSATMWHSSLLLSLLAAFITCVNATALTYKLAANEKACFFAEVQPEQVNAKIAFYFAVRHALAFAISSREPPSKKNT